MELFNMFEWKLRVVEDTWNFEVGEGESLLKP